MRSKRFILKQSGHWSGRPIVDWDLPHYILKSSYIFQGGNLKKLKPLMASLLLSLVSVAAQATFIPQDQIRFESLTVGPSNITKEGFMAAIAKLKAVYEAIVRAHGATLTINEKWSDGTINASAQQFGNSWQINLYGGLARRPELTPDAYMMVMCHEMGHHLGGFSFYQPFFGDVWAANEGQSDYFATHSCARKMWGEDLEENAKFRESVPEIVKTACDKSWNTTEAQDLCYRVSAAAKSLGATLASLTQSPEPQYDTPDTNKVAETSDEHPAPQCRLDTTFQAALCTIEFDANLIPGKEMNDPFSVNAEREAAIKSCTSYSNQNVGLRPQCWFKARI